MPSRTTPSNVHSDSDEIFDGSGGGQAPTELSSTGVPYLDRMLCGGTAPGEVYGFMGPYGSCKTTLAIQLQVEAVRRFAAESAEGGEKKVAVLVNYETSKPETQLRMMSYAARIPRDQIENLRHHGASTTEELQPYELEANRGVHSYARPAFHTGEQERMAEARTWLNEHTVVIDMMRGSAGHGGIQEVAEEIEKALNKRGCRCGFIAIDYLGAMAKRKLANEESGTASNAQKLSRVVGELAAQSRQCLAVALDCPVWLIHQLTGDANRRSAAAELDHTDAANCAFLGEYLDFSFSVGVMRKDQTAKLQCTKYGRKPPRASTIIKVNGAWSRVDEACGISVDPRTRELIARREIDVFRVKWP